MTIETWNIVLSAVILVLLTVGGLWLKYVVDQQLKSKDTAIQALESVVKIKDAHIASLEGNTAPAIVKAYADMRQHADQVTEDSQKLATQLAEVTNKQQREKELLSPKIILGQVSGMQWVSDLLEETVWNLVFPDGQNLDPRFIVGDCESLLDQIFTMNERLNQEMSSRLETGSDLMGKVRLLHDK